MKEFCTTVVLIITTIVLCLLGYLFFMKGAIVVSNWGSDQNQTASVTHALDMKWILFSPEGKKFSAYFPEVPQFISKDYPISTIEIMTTKEGSELYEVERIVARKSLSILPTGDDLKSFVYNFADARHEKVSSMKILDNKGSTAMAFNLNGDSSETEGRVYAPDTETLFIVLYSAPVSLFNQGHKDTFLEGFSLSK